MAATTTRGVSASQNATTAQSGSGGTEGSSEEGGKKSKKKLIIIAVVGLLVLGVGAKMTILKPAAKTPAEVLAAEKAKPKVYGPIVALDEQTLNLADGHFLKLKVVIQLKKTAKIVAAKGEEVSPELTLAAQAVLDNYSTFTQQQLTGAAGQLKAKVALEKRLEPIYPEEVADIYTPEFLMSS